MGRRTKLTPVVHKAVVGFIRNGAFDYVAAQAAGISMTTFGRWMRRGRKRTEEPYRSFWSDVCNARAQARVIAENKVYSDNPLAWLRYGPGRERPGEPGWTDSRKVDMDVTSGGEPLKFEVVYVNPPPPLKTDDES